MRNTSHASKGAPDQRDLFAKPVFASRDRQADADFDLDRFRLRMKTAMAEALRPHDRADIAARMGRMLGSGAMSKGMLDAYCSPGKDADISLVRFKALTRATGAHILWDRAIADEGLTILIRDEARLAEIARLQQEQMAISAELKRLRAQPVILQRGDAAK